MTGKRLLNAALNALVAGSLLLGLAMLAAPVAAQGFVEITIAQETTSGLSVRTMVIREDRVDHVLANLSASGVHAGRTSSVRALTDPLQQQQWGYQRMGGSQLWEAQSDANSVVVAVLDTGVDSSHPDLTGRVLPGYDMIQGKPMLNSYDDNGHGTHVAGVISAITGNGEGIAGLTPSSILPVKVLDETGYGDDAGVARGIVWAVDNGADILNLSLGTYDDNPAMAAAVQYATKRGVVVVAAAGNDGSGGPTTYPAAYSEAVAVGATTPTDTRAIFSTTSAYVDLAAPGQGILSTFPGGQYLVLSGTSMAAPHVAGSVAAVMGIRGMSGARAVRELERTAVDLGPDGNDSQFGAGLVNLPVATGTGETIPWEGGGGLPIPELPPLPVLEPGPLPTLPLPSMPALPPLEPPTLPGSPEPGQPQNPGLPTPRPDPNYPESPTNTTLALLATVLPLTDQDAVRLTIRVSGAEQGTRVRIRATGDVGTLQRSGRLNSMGTVSFSIPNSYTQAIVRAAGIRRNIPLQR